MISRPYDTRRFLNTDHPDRLNDIAAKAFHQQVSADVAGSYDRGGKFYSLRCTHTSVTRCLSQAVVSLRGSPTRFCGGMLRRKLAADLGGGNPFATQSHTKPISWVCGFKWHQRP